LLRRGTNAAVPYRALSVFKFNTPIGETVCLARKP
jgi:hypothetical protein